MDLQIPALDQLIHELNRLPGIGQKSAQRLAYHILKAPEMQNEKLREVLKNVAEQIRPCTCCFSYTDQEELCRICLDDKRQDDLICVVEEPFDILPIESSGSFRGRFHVLHGTISPLEGISPSDLRINELLARIDQSQSSESPVNEVILALDADLEGDTTVLYLTKKIQERGIRVSRIAHGVPIGGDIDYIDHRTLGRALDNRVEL